MQAWFRSREKRKTGQLKRRAGATESVQKSLALNVLFHQFREGQKYNILDLGPASNQNIEFFSQFSCKLYIEDLYETLSSFDFFSPEDGFTYDAVLSYLLPYPKTVRFDLILAWDLFNYLERDVLRNLIQHLSKFSHTGTLLLGLISTRKHIPETPYQFKILDPESMIYRASSSVMKPCPRYEGRDLGHLLPEFRVCNSFLLRNGFKEYLFVRE
jgi:hypothetical protein